MQENMNSLRKFFLYGINSVQPQNLITKWLQRDGEILRIGERMYDIKDTFIVGFGKAVGGMVPHIASELKKPNGNYIKKGIVSVPFGYLDYAKSNNLDLTSNPEIQFYEGAIYNLPDRAAESTSERILKLVDSLRGDNLLLVLISGGGSALLPLPVAPLTLEEKTKTIKSLSLAGASITELNTVRKSISATKGGKLIQSTKAQVVSFILSDIINSPLGMIASGPTVPNNDPLCASFDILQKYNIPITDNLKSVLKTRCNDTSQTLSNVYNVLIGDNNTALNCIYDYLRDIKELNCWPFIMTSSLQGNATQIGNEIAKLAFIILSILSDKSSENTLESFCKTLCISQTKVQELKTFLHSVRDKSCSQSLCLLFGGETTVEVKGTGKGGRNQEMVLSASLEMEKLSKSCNAEGKFVFLSGGTDGVDGPTDAAGAITFYSNCSGKIRLQTSEARQQGLSPEEYLMNNDSYTYFSELSDGIYHLKPGQTGTNVMDIQLLYITNR